MFSRWFSYCINGFSRVTTTIGKLEGGRENGGSRTEEGGMWNVDDRSSSHQVEREGMKVLELSQGGAMEGWWVMMDGGRWTVDDGRWMG